MEKMIFKVVYVAIVVGSVISAYAFFEIFKISQKYKGVADVEFEIIIFIAILLALGSLIFFFKKLKKDKI